MIKKTFSLLLAICLLTPLCFSAFADGLPFKTIEAPGDMRFVLSYPNEGNECIEAVYSVPDDLCAIASASADFQDQHYHTAFISCVQFDWAVDDVKAFHYDESWDSTKSDSPIRPISGSFVEKSEVLWFAYEADAARCDGALKAEKAQIDDPEPQNRLPGLAADEPETDTTEPIEPQTTIYTFDFDRHDLFVRARFFVYEDKTGNTHYSAWSEPLNVEKNLGKNVKMPKKSTDAPLLTKGTDEGNGLFSFDIGFTDAFEKTAQALKSISDTELDLEAQLRVDGGEWTYLLMPDALYPYRVGNRQFTVSAEDASKKIEFRCRLSGGNPDFSTDITTGWSSILIAENGKVQIVENDDPFEEKAREAERIAAEKEANQCKLCGFCPFHPFGVCMFLWLGLLIIVALIVWFILARKKKAQAKAAEIEARRAASAQSDNDKTKSFVQTDRIALQPTAKEENTAQKGEEPEHQDQNGEDENHED